MNILADISLPGLSRAFPSPFHITYYTHPEQIPGLLDGQQVLLCRSTLKVNENLIKNHSLHYVATASSGTDHLDTDFLNKQNIQIIDAKGSNAISVADYMIACIAYLEKKSLIQGKKAAIIGMGKVGTQVWNRLKAAKYAVAGYDPKKALDEKEFHSCELSELYQADLICVHAQLHNTQPYPSFNLINQEFLTQLKPGCVLINAARGGVINENALLAHSKPIIYCTDVYDNEPDIQENIVAKATLCTPHIAGHSLEAKFAAVAMVSEKLHSYFGIPAPVFAQPSPIELADTTKNQTWQDLILSIYNPEYETTRLKDAPNKEDAFLIARMEHQHRHNFYLYHKPENSKKIHSLLGGVR